MKDQALVSIITPSYNQGKFIEETILSVLNQTYQNIEYIIIDGGSSDNSIELIKKYENKLSYWVSEKDLGQADAINKGFSKAKGDYLCWANSDDILYPNFIADRIQQFKKYSGVEIIYGDVDQGWDLNKPVIRKGKQQSYEEMLKTCLIRVPQMSAIWSRKVYEQIGGLDIKLNVLLDWEYFLRMAENFNILYISGSVGFFRQHANSKSVKFNSSWALEIERYYLDHFSPNNDQTKIKSECLVNMYLFCAELYLQDKNTSDAEKYFLKAKQENPSLYLKKRFKKLFIDSIIKTKNTIIR